MTGRRVITTLGLVLLATAVLPPAAAWGVNRSRVRLAAADVSAVGEMLRRAEAQLRDLAHDVEVLSGPGRMPFVQSPGAQRWTITPRADLAVVVGRSPAADPWGNCYVVNLAAIAAGEPAVVWVLSAGPNGIVDTPFVSASEVPAGDDVGMRVR